jgi:hypothetical protein
VLALACCPALAQANSSGAQYESELPNVPSPESSPGGGENPGSPGGGENGKAHVSGATPGGGGGGNGKGGSGGPGGEGTAHQGNPGSEGGGDRKTGDSGPAGKQPGQGKPQLKSATPAAGSSDSSSPLVPILIAVAVLAAISVGAFYYRQRRQDSGSPVSPKAS